MGILAVTKSSISGLAVLLVTVVAGRRVKSFIDSGLIPEKDCPGTVPGGPKVDSVVAVARQLREIRTSHPRYEVPLDMDIARAACHMFSLPLVCTCLAKLLCAHGKKRASPIAAQEKIHSFRFSEGGA